jgi:hypothetical protein
LPSKLSDCDLSGIADYVGKAVLALGLDQSLFHAELRMQDGDPVLMEIGARVGFARTLEHGLGLDVGAAGVDLCLGREVAATPTRSVFAGTFVITPKKRGTYHGVANLAEVRRDHRIVDVRIVAKVGEVVVPPPEGNSYVGFIMAAADTYDRVLEALECAADLLQPEIK